MTGTLQQAHRTHRVQEKLRQIISAAPILLRLARSARAVMHFGPWRPLARALIRHSRPPMRVLNSSGCTISFPNAARLNSDLRADGIAHAGLLETSVLQRVRAISDNLPAGEYAEFQVIPDVCALTECAANIARDYLQAEPELLECSLFISNPEIRSTERKLDSDCDFYFEDAGWHSLSLFVHLTEFSKESGAYQFVVGTHRTMTLQEAVRGVFPESAIRTRYSDRLRSFTGPPGTLLFADTTAIHRRRIYSKRHAIIHILFVSHRSWASRGRRLPTYLEYLRAHCDI